MKIVATPSVRLASRIFCAFALSVCLNTARATTYYWDTNGTSAGLGSATTPANWNGSAFWNTDSAGSNGGTVTTPTWTGTANSAILAGTAGTITLNTSTAGAGTVTVNTNGYVLTSSAATRGLVASSLVLANNVGLELNTNSGAGGSGTSSVWALGGVTFGSGSTLTVSGGASAANGNTIYLNSATTISGGAITLAGSGAGVTGFVSSSGLVNLNTVITNNSSTSLTQLGASSTGSLTMGAKVTGSAGLMFGGKSGTASGGAGIITLNAANDYRGATIFNAAAGGVIKLGIDNALPTGTDVTMAASASNGGILDINGHDQEIASLTSGAGGGSITNGGASGTNTLKISGSATPAAFGLAITDGATAKTALTRSGTGTTILSGANTYTGATLITGGTLTVSGSLGNTAVSLSNAGSTLSSGANITSAITGGVTAGAGTFITPGGAGTVGTFTLGSLTLNDGSTLSMDLLGNSNYDKIVTSGTLTLGSGVETINIAGSGFSAGSYTLISGYSSLSGGVFTLGSTPGSFTYSLATGGTSTVLTVAGLGGSGNLTWSVNGLAPTSGTEGAGTWANGGANFYNTGTSSTTTWDNTATNNLTVGSGGAGGTLTLGGNVRVGGALTFASVTSPYTIGAVNGTNTLTLAGGITANNSATINAPTVLEASQTWSVANGDTLTANGSISETGGVRTLTKDGAGTLVLAGAGNVYTGGTTVIGGTLSISSGSSAGTSAATMTLNSGTTLAGAGTVNGATSVNSATINGSGLTLTGAVAFNGTGNILNGTVISAGGASLAANTDLTVNGTLTGTGASVSFAVNGNNASLTNLGTISQTGAGRVIRDNTGVTGLVINNGSATNSAAVIQTADADVIQMNKAAANVTFNNYGTLTSLNASAGGSQAIDFNAIQSGSNILNNYSTGLVQASEADAVRPGVNGFVYNDGTIKSTTSSGSSSDGVDAQTNSGITIVNASALSGDTTGTGLIEGARHGITGGNSVADVNGNPTVANGAFTLSITNNLGGTIQGDNGSGINIDGLNANEVVTIVNHGAITGNGMTADGDGVDVDGIVNLTNTGTIHSLNSLNDTSEGATVGGGTITNSGTIEGSISNSTGNTGTGRGITIAGIDKYTDTNGVDHTIPVQAPYAATTITNQAGGLIKGDSDSGIAFTSALSSGFSHTINNNAGATIQGGGTTVAAIVTSADNVTINNAGMIDGSSSGKAITGGSGGLVVNITGASASVLGDITGVNGVANTMTISAGAGNSFSYAGTVANFNTVTVFSGSFTLSGQLTLALNGASAGVTGGYGQLVVNSGGALTLGSGSLISLSLGFTPTIGEQFTVINMVDGSTTITGTFANLAEGSTYTQDGVSYLVSYEGGTGNDLVLTVTSAAIPEPATTAMIFAGLASAAALVLRRRRQTRA